MAAIVDGTYRTETVAGYVADFCPVCRDIQSFKVIRLGDASHLAFVLAVLVGGLFTLSSTPSAQSAVSALNLFPRL